MIILLLILSLFVADVVGAVTYNVKTTGHPTDCAQATTATGVATIPIALGCVLAADGSGAGDIVEVYGGMYTQTIDANLISLPKGASGNPFTLRGRVGETAIIKASGAEHNLRIFFSSGNRDAYWIIDNLTFDGSNLNNMQIVFGPVDPTASPRFITFQNNQVINTRWENGILINPGTGDLTITRNKFHDGAFEAHSISGGGPFGYAIYFSSDSANISIDHNEFYNFPQFGIHGFDGITGIGPTNSTIAFNTFHDFGPLNPSGFLGDGRSCAILNYNGSGNRIYGNLIYNGGTAGICIGARDHLSQDLVYNNTIYNMRSFTYNSIPYDGTGIAVGGRQNTFTNNISSNNQVFNVQTTNTFGTNTFSNSVCSPVGGTTNCAAGVSGNVNETSATTFVSPGTDFHLKAGSAAIGGGFNLITPPYDTDITGAPRTVPWDIGAYEFGGTVSVASVTWTSNRGGPLDSLGMTGPNSGSASLIGTNWTISNIPLSAGINNLDVVYTDTSGGKTTDSLVVTYAPTFPGNTLAGAWSFDNVVTDSSGNVPPNNATLVNGAVVTSGAGRFGAGALVLDGVDDYALVGDANSLDFTQSFTFSTWGFPTSVQTSYKAAITKNYMIALYAQSGSPCATLGVPSMYFRVNGQSGPDYFACGSSLLPINQWTHLAGTYDGSNLRLYVNGVLATTTAATGYIEPSALSMQIGASQFSNEYFAGRIDEARVYNYAILPSTAINITPGVACTTAMFNDNVSNPSIIGNMNCPIIAPVSPVTIKFPASATGLKVGSAASGLKLGTQ